MKGGENIAKLAEYMAKMENAVMDANSLESAIQSLVIAIGCLRRVLSYLPDRKVQWQFASKLAGQLKNWLKSEAINMVREREVKT